MAEQRLSDDPHWLAALRAQDRQAFTRMVGTYHQSMLALARSLVGDAANDIVQESWLSAYGALPSFEGNSTIKTWLLRITTNQALSHLRSNQRKREVTGVDDGLDERFDDAGRWRRPPAPWHHDSPEALVLSDELGELLDQAVNGLPALQKAVLQLREGDNLAVAEICKILDISSSNVYVLLHRARVRLWAVIDAYQGSGNHVAV